MENGAYAGLRMAARAAGGDPENNHTLPGDEEEIVTGEHEEDEDMTKEEHEAALAKASADARAEGRAEGFAEANQRAATVMASEHYAGREKLAAKLLEKDALSADDIVGMLEAAEPASPANADGDDTAARAEMRANLAAEQPEPTGEGGSENLSAEDNSLVDNMKARFPGAK